MPKGYPMVRALNARAWAIGVPTASGFRARRVVWGWSRACEERRDEEELRSAVIMVRKQRRRLERKNGQGDA
jgi:hypothetical protein